MNAAQLLVQCLENEGVEYIFGIPGEENLDIMDALLHSHIRFVTVRHEQGAAFMADVYGRLTGKAGVCLKARDLPWYAVEKADLVICVGYDMVEYHPDMWNPANGKTIVHIDALSAEVDAHYCAAVECLGHIPSTLRGIAALARPQRKVPFTAVRRAIVEERAVHAADSGFPVKPQKIVWDLREVLAPDDIVISDVGAHKMWMARMYRAERPNTCIISNGFASMGIAVPGALAAKLACPQRKVVAVTGDAGFLMNSQEIETALRMQTPFVILIWSDAEYGLITWHQMRQFGRPSHVTFTNPDFVKYAESFGAKGYRVTAAAELVPTLRQALADDTVAIVDCPVDYAENMQLTRNLGDLVSLYDV